MVLRTMLFHPSIYIWSSAMLLQSVTFMIFCCITSKNKEELCWANMGIVEELCYFLNTRILRMRGGNWSQLFLSLNLATTKCTNTACVSPFSSRIYDIELELQNYF